MKCLQCGKELDVSTIRAEENDYDPKLIELGITCPACQARMYTYVGESDFVGEGDQAEG